MVSVREAAGGGGTRDTESKTRTPHKDVGKKLWQSELAVPYFQTNPYCLINTTHVTRPQIRCHSGIVRSSNLVLKLFSAMSKESWHVLVSNQRTGEGPRSKPKTPWVAAVTHWFCQKRGPNFHHFPSTAWKPRGFAMANCQFIGDVSIFQTHPAPTCAALLQLRLPLAKKTSRALPRKGCLIGWSGGPSESWSVSIVSCFSYIFNIVTFMCIIFTLYNIYISLI